jgi:hypothetical protein
VDSNVYISALVPGEVPQGGFDIVGTDDIASLAWRLERLGDSLWSLAAGRRQPKPVALRRIGTAAFRPFIPPSLLA